MTRMINCLKLCFDESARTTVTISLKRQICVCYELR